MEARPEVAPDDVAGYEIVFSYVGTPMKLVPKTGDELASKSRVHLVSVNEPVQAEHPCRRLVTKRNGRWELANNGQSLVDLLIY